MFANYRWNFHQLIIHFVIRDYSILPLQSYVLITYNCSIYHNYLVHFIIFKCNIIKRDFNLKTHYINVNFVISLRVCTFSTIFRGIVGAIHKIITAPLFSFAYDRLIRSCLWHNPSCVTAQHNAVLTAKPYARETRCMAWRVQHFHVTDPRRFRDASQVNLRVCIYTQCYAVPVTQPAASGRVTARYTATNICAGRIELHRFCLHRSLLLAKPR